ncbi:DNA-binding LytR/AlgR family response regulator [Flavobacterium gossypii]|nr:DNA-binding LytR/AlgR family response regulator [Flavobacterium gossypii]
MEYIGKIDPWFSGNLLVHMPKETKVEISRRQTNNFKEKMSL